MFHILPKRFPGFWVNGFIPQLTTVKHFRNNDILFWFSRGPDFDTRLFGEYGVTVEKLLGELYEKVCTRILLCRSSENQNTHSRMLIFLNSVYWTAKLWRMRYLCDAFDDVITENVLERVSFICSFPMPVPHPWAIKLT